MFCEYKLNISFRRIYWIDMHVTHISRGITQMWSRLLSNINKNSLLSETWLRDYYAFVSLV